MDRTDILSLTYERLGAFMEQMGQPSYRTGQVFGWLHGHMAKSFGDMTNLSKELRQKLAESADIALVETVERQDSKEAGVSKYLFGLKGGDVIESVLMGYGYGETVCVSSQAGCRMGCVFCASARNGLSRGLSAGEIAGQVYGIRRDTGRRVANVVVMGTGEPFDNYDNVMTALWILNDKRGQNIGQRCITVSTCGLVDGIYRFAEADTQFNLAVSLHAPNDDIRARLMPVAKRHPMEELLRACAYYQAQTRRRVTYEYALVPGVNDSISHARELAGRIKGTLCHVNLMALNSDGASGLAKANPAALEAFAAVLKGHGVETTLRRGRGADIEAACGQLRHRHLAQNQK